MPPVAPSSNATFLNVKKFDLKYLCFWTTGLVGVCLVGSMPPSLPLPVQRPSPKKPEYLSITRERRQPHETPPDPSLEDVEDLPNSDQTGYTRT